MTPVEQALQEGYTQDEINEYLVRKRGEAKEFGYSDDDINAYIKQHITQQPDFNKTPLESKARQHLSVKRPTNLMEAFETGFNWSSLGLGLEAMKKGGHLPEMAIDTETPIHLRAAANVAGIVSDIPAIIAGGAIGGGPISPITAAGGGFALPMGLRKVFADALENNEIGSRKEFADRVMGTAWETAKGFITGVATAGAGRAVAGAVSTAPAFVKATVPTAAELATLTTVGAALEGHAPEPQALLDNAIALGVAKAVLPNWTRAKPLTDIYVKTGKHPEQVTTDALKDPSVWQDVLDGRVPSAYKHDQVHGDGGQTQNQRAPKVAVPESSTASKKQAGRLLQRYEEPGVEPGDPTKPHGLYTSPAEIDSPHKDLGGERTLWELDADANTLKLTDFGKEAAIRKDAISAGAGVHAVKQLLGDDVFLQLKNGTKADAIKYASEKFPGPDYSRYYDKQEVLEAIGAQAARKAGYDAMELIDTGPLAKFGGDFSEVVVLNAAKARKVDGKQGQDKRQQDNAETPIVRHRKAAKNIESALPPVSPNHTRLWRGNRPGEETTATQYTNDLPGIALPFRELYGGRVSYVDVPTEQLSLFEQKSGAAPGAEFNIPKEYIANVKTVAEKQSFQEPLTPEQQSQAQAFFDQPFADIPQMPNEPARPGHINYNYRQAPEELYQTLARSSEIYYSKIAKERKSPERWAESTRQAAELLGDMVGADAKTILKFVQGDPETPTVTAELLARRDLALKSAEDLMRKRAALSMKGDAVTPEEMADFFAQAEFMSNIHAGFLGKRADVGRAQNALKSTARAFDRVGELTKIIEEKGGPENFKKLIDMMGEYDNPGQVFQAAKKMSKATRWDMVIEAWKAGLVSGLRTNEINFLSTAAFTTLRLPTESIAAVLGTVRRGDDKVMYSEIPARMIGMMAGVRDGLKVAGAVLKTGANVTGTKTDTKGPAIPGKTGEVVRSMFRPLSASDMLFKTINERGELYALAVKQAIKDGHENPGSQSFFSRVSELVANPTEEMSTQAKDAALRFTFNKPLGPGGKSFLHLTREWPVLQLMFPFITTPGNIFKETVRMTPGLNFAVKEWRQAYEQGGAARDKALAEVAIGTAIMSAIVAAVQDGVITGNGTPDKGVRSTQYAAGWKPYAVKIGDEYVDGYLRMAPIGPLIGIAADSAEFFSYMSDGERDQWARMLAFAFAKNVTNQTFLSGMTNFVNLLQDPQRYGENYFEALASSIVPGILGQTAQEMDPLMREIHGMSDAMKARIPWQREGLMPKRDLFGQPIQNPERLWWGSPFSTTPISTDKVRTEAARLGFAAPDIPAKIDVLPGLHMPSIDMVPLKPEQKDVFATTSGQMAHTIMGQIVNQPAWEKMPDIIKRQTYEKAFKHSRDYASKQALLGLDPSVTNEAIRELRQQMSR